MASIDSQAGTWGDYLREYDEGRRRPPPPESYSRHQVVKYKDAGIIPDSVTECRVNPADIVPCDNHLYATTALFDPEEKKPRPVRPPRDHGKDIVSWPKKPIVIDTPPFVPRMKPRDFDVITGAALESPFKTTVKQLMERRESALQSSMRRSMDPISNTFPTAQLEATRGSQEALMRQASLSHRLSQMPRNEQRAHMGTVNIVSGETTDESLAGQTIREFPRESLHRAQLARDREARMVEENLVKRDRDAARRSCRFSNGARAVEMRDWEMADGVQTMSSEIKDKPSVWQWCKQEQLDVPA